MTDTHVIHKMVGGAGHIVQLLEQRGGRVVKARLNLNTELLCGGQEEVSKVFFHQPYSHLCCLLYALRNLGDRKRLCCVLHEASNYNVGVARNWRAYTGTLSRLIVLWLCFLIGVEVRGVSKYVCASYRLPSRKVSYLYLFRSSLSASIDTSIAKSDMAIVWLRRGGSELSISAIARLRTANSLSAVIVLGDQIECDKFITKLGSNPLLYKVMVIEEKYRVSEQRFFKLLQSSRWFVSVYPKEGFGLSAFQAIYFGCIVLAQRAGALAEWLPAENYEVFDKLKDGCFVTADEIAKTSKNNSKFAGKYILNEN